MLPSIFVADTKIIYGYNFVAPLITTADFNTLTKIVFDARIKNVTKKPCN